jgi:hypothetical protein
MIKNKLNLLWENKMKKNNENKSILRTSIAIAVNAIKYGIKIKNTSDFARHNSTKISINRSQINAAWGKVIVSNK